MNVVCDEMLVIELLVARRQTDDRSDAEYLILCLDTYFETTNMHGARDSSSRNE